MTTLRQPSQRRLRHTNNRQRKKLHLGDYKQLRGDITIQFKGPLDAAGFEAWLGKWIAWVEENHLYAAMFGGAQPQPFTQTEAMLLAEKSLTQEQLDQAVAWLKASPEVAGIPYAALRDATYDTFGSH